MENATNNKMKMIYTVVERSPGRSFWTRVGVGFVNSDGSINVKLDAIPTNGTLQVRDFEPRDAERGEAGRGEGGRDRARFPPRGKPRDDFADTLA